MWPFRSKAPSRPAPVPGTPSAIAGNPPHPAASIVELPGIRLIDLRGLPEDDLAAVRLGVAQAQLRLERPGNVQIWVVDVATARGWTRLGAALGLVATRLIDPRFPGAANYLYTSGGTLSESEETALAEVGLRVARGMINMSDPPRDIEQLLAAPPRWAPSPHDRPVPEHDVIRDGLLGEEMVHVLSDFGFVDLRRAVPEAIRNGHALSRIEDGVRRIAKIEHSHLAWVAAPWVLELLPDAQLSRLEAVIASVAPRIQQRLAIVTAHGEPVGEHELIRRLGGRLPPVKEKLSWKTAIGTFEVPPIVALHDMYFWKAWRQPRG